MKIYISGPMSGYKDMNYQRFFVVEFLIEQNIPNAEVVNPAAITANALSEGLRRDYESIMERDLEALKNCDAIYMIHGWEESPGAKRELELAKELKIYEIYENDFKINEVLKLIESTLDELNTRTP